MVSIELQDSLDDLTDNKPDSTRSQLEHALDAAWEHLHDCAEGRDGCALQRAAEELQAGTRRWRW